MQCGARSTMLTCPTQRHACRKHPRAPGDFFYKNGKMRQHDWSYRYTLRWTMHLRSSLHEHATLHTGTLITDSKQEPNKEYKRYREQADVILGGSRDKGTTAALVGSVIKMGWEIPAAPCLLSWPFIS